MNVHTVRVSATKLTVSGQRWKFGDHCSWISNLRVKLVQWEQINRAQSMAPAQPGKEISQQLGETEEKCVHTEPDLSTAHVSRAALLMQLATLGSCPNVQRWLWPLVVWFLRKRGRHRQEQAPLTLPCSSRPKPDFGTLSKKLFLPKQHIFLLPSRPELVLFQSNNKVLHAPRAADCNQRLMWKANGPWVTCIFLAKDNR